MTLIDENALRSLLRGAANKIEIPKGNARDVVDRVRRMQVDDWDDVDSTLDHGATSTEEDPESDSDNGFGDRSSRVTRFRMSGHRVLRVAAIVVVILLLVGVGSIVLGTGGGRVHTERATLSGRSIETFKKGSVSFGSTPAKTLAGGTVTFGAGKPANVAAGSAPHAGASPATPAGSLPSPTPVFPTNAVTGSAKVEESGSLSLSIRAHHLGGVVDELTALAAENGGYVTSSSIGSPGSTGTGQPAGSITLEVPQAKFETVLADAKHDGSVTAVSTKATDVTGQYVDLQSEITALDATRKQYLTIMTQATSVPDILSVQGQIDSIQTQIQQLQGQLQLLTSQASFSKLDVSVTERPGPGAPRPAGKSGFRNAVDASVHGFVADFDAVVREVGPVAFILLFGLLLLGLGRFAWREYCRRSL